MEKAEIPKFLGSIISKGLIVFDMAHIFCSTPFLNSEVRLFFCVGLFLVHSNFILRFLYLGNSSQNMYKGGRQ